MILFWILAAVITAAAVSLLVWPLRRCPGPVPARGGYDLEVYRDQLAEVDRDLSRGVIGDGQADAARAEIGRRILALSSRGDSEPAPALALGWGGRLVLPALVGVIPVAALGVYLVVGRPDLPAQPVAARQQAQAVRPAPSGTMGPAEIDAAVARLAQRLKAEPANLQGWQLLAQSLSKLERYSEAVDAWRHALALAKDDADVQGGLAEALTAANQGLVPDEARQLFEGMQITAPKDPRSSHYLALARAQAGDFRGALDRWVALAAASPADAPWLPLVRAGVEDMARRLNLDPATAMPKPLPPRAASTAAPSQPGPPAAGTQTADAPGVRADQEKAIRSMVDGLATRLKANPADVDGWLRLAHSYEVLGEDDRQLEALKQAKAHGGQRVDVLVTYAEAVVARAQPAPEDGGRVPAEAVDAYRAALVLAPDTPAALWYLGLDAAASGHSAEARGHWQKLLTRLDATSSDYGEVKARIDALK